MSQQSVIFNLYLKLGVAFLLQLERKHALALGHNAVVYTVVTGPVVLLHGFIQSVPL